MDREAEEGNVRADRIIPGHFLSSTSVAIAVAVNAFRRGDGELRVGRDGLPFDVADAVALKVDDLAVANDDDGGPGTSTP